MRKHLVLKRTLLSLLVGGMGAPHALMAAPLSLAQYPAGTASVEPAPNVIVSVDDSGSMGSTGIASLKSALKATFAATNIPDNRIRLAWQSMHNCREIPYSASGGNPCGGKNAMKPLAGTHRTNFLTWVDTLSHDYSWLSETQYTPSHALVRNAGTYLSMAAGNENPWNATPGTADASPLNCRKAFHIFMTDGEWNGRQVSGTLIDASRTTSTRLLRSDSGNLDGTTHTLPDGTVYDTSSTNNQTRAYRDSWGLFQGRKIGAQSANPLIISRNIVKLVRFSNASLFRRCVTRPQLDWIFGGIRLTFALWSGGSCSMLSGLLAYLDSVKARDPAPRSRWEILLYPGIWALAFHRVAHWLFRGEMFFLARLVNHLGRLLTAIDIHPGARIGRNFFIDHGFVTIGETAEIGDNVTIYPCVTLGGTNPTNGVSGKRHPTLCDDAIIGSGAQILGPITIGRRARVGANAVVVEDVAEGATMVGPKARSTLVKAETYARDFVPYGTPCSEIFDPQTQKLELLQCEVETLRKKIVELMDEKHSRELDNMGRDRA